MLDVKPVLFIQACHTSGDLCGFVQESHEAEAVPFKSTFELMHRIEMYVNAPRRAKDGGVECQPYKDWAIDPCEWHKRGHMNYIVEIMANEHHSWQGRLTCTLGKHFFRSERELFFMMEEAYATRKYHAANKKVHTISTFPP